MDQVIIIISGLVILSALGFALYLLSKREKYRGKEIGFIIIDYATENAMTVLFVLMSACIVSEGWIAASLATDDPKHTINPVARILAHTALTLINLLGTVFFVKELQQIVKVFKTKNVLYILYYLLLLFVSALLTVVPVFINLQVVANHLEQEQAVAVLYSFLFDSSETYYNKIETLQLNSITFHPFFHIHPVLIVSSGVSAIHILAAFFEGLLLVITAYRYTLTNGKQKDSAPKVVAVKKETPSETPKEATEKSVSTQRQHFEDKNLAAAITTLLTYLGYSGDLLESTRSIIISSFKSALVTMTDNKQAAIATALARLLLYIESAPKTDETMFKRTMVNAMREPIGEIVSTRYTDAEGNLILVPGFNVSLQIFT